MYAPRRSPKIVNVIEVTAVTAFNGCPDRGVGGVGERDGRSHQCTGGRVYARFLAADGREQRRVLAQAAEVAFEDVAAVRSFPLFRGQRNNTGWWWCAMNRRHVGFESWLERDHVIRLDFTPEVVTLKRSRPVGPP
jgi:hypothetical protein